MKKPNARARMFIGTLAVICLSSFTVAAFPQTAVDNAWTVLHTGLSDKSTSNRSVAVRLLGLLENNPKALELALQALTDQKSDVRAASAGALGQMNAKSAIPKLQDLINTEKDSAVIITAAHSLIQLGDSIGFNVYYADLTGERKFGQGLLEEQKKMLNDPKKMARIGFEQAIGFVPFGGISYTAFKMIRKDSVSAVRAAAAKVLADDPDPKTAEALVNAATSDKSWLVRDAALDAISHRGDPTLSSRIEPALNDNKSIVRYTAAAAIIHLADIKSANRASTN